MMFEVKKLCASYGKNADVVKSVSFQIDRGEVFCLLGRNGAGKSSTLKSIMGLMPKTQGSIILDGSEVSGHQIPAHEIPAKGIGYVPQGRRLFAELTVRENLQVGLLCQNGNPDFLARSLDLFPRLKERLNQISGTLSGGEQQMLATARALCLNPKLLLLDEPTEGLMPSMISAIRQAIVELAGSGMSVLLVEQRVDAVFSIASHVSSQVGFMENGRLLEQRDLSELSPDDELIKRYIGVA